MVLLMNLDSSLEFGWYNSVDIIYLCYQYYDQLFHVTGVDVFVVNGYLFY